MTQKPKFYQVTVATSKKLRNSGLTAAEWRIFAYLSELDPYGDRKDGIPFSPAKLREECSVSKSTYFTAKAKLQKLGIFDFSECESTRITNLHSPKKHSEKLDTHSEKLDTHSEKLDTHSEKLDTHSEKLDVPIYIDHARDQTKQTNTDLIQTEEEEDRAESKKIDSSSSSSSSPLFEEGDNGISHAEILVETQSTDETVFVGITDLGEDQTSPAAACNTERVTNVIHEGEIVTDTSTGSSLAIADLTDKDRALWKKISNLRAMNCYNAPWRDGATIKPACIEALFKRDMKHFSLEGQTGKIDRVHARNTITKQERLLGGQPLEAIAAYQWLMELAADGTPEVKEVVERIEQKNFERHREEEIEKIRQLLASV
jgi:DNA-binding MarR family transcriptional regulator